MNCRYCAASCRKKGKYNGVQKYQCKSCYKYQRECYRQQSYGLEAERSVVSLNNEGVGIRSISRIMEIPKSTVQLMLFKASLKVKMPILKETGQTYEVDELFASIGGGDKYCYITYAINKKTRQIVDYVIGRRTKVNVGKVVNTLLRLSPRKIYTDKMPVFSYIIPKSIHEVFKYKTNRIERKNLTLRTHLKRLSRKTICYSKSIRMLDAYFRLYAWK